ncbi:aminotransferase class I/II-fold pyridoxal phosphate-dependent enzyme [Paenactinomyces guangxiensis]|uniref:Methionine gamma-lyase family protein n=1 Tax=Paenactinomyces guangxiensis TaxID=1490290 RepID=A0A7W2A7E1_9BACL|nr:methionine gamma-lyase family protein [Paenactinomyces guangxiensis]MBA4494446.1 methionine gamma-lyase family protein [Paenactinomyces guangxiensis]MBH8591499.1 methionine gamma-lyase family protein [Paenactinomyces guangxiensis]
MYKHLSHGFRIKQIVTEIEQKIVPVIRKIEEQAEYGQWKVLDFFRKHGVSEHHLQSSTGYGYDDLGRDTLEKVFADLFGAEMALVRPNIISGTHAIAACLYGILRPGDELIYLTGKPYDTLQQVIGSGQDGSGSLADYNISYQEVPLTPEGSINWPRFEQALTHRTRLIGIQRSRGYSARPSFTISQIKEIINHIRAIRPDLLVFVDNCYGEFVEAEEPTHAGADIIAGSLIKNPGGGLAKSGGYITGKAKWVKRAASRLVAPGIGLEGGATYGYLRDFFQGLFLAPHVVGEALKGAVFTSALLEELGFDTSPGWQEKRTDIIQQIHLGSPERLVAFCQGIQSASPVDAHISPVPAAMPGYEDPVIMAAGTFVQGASIELSADGPIRPPYIAYLQGGLTYSHVKIAVIQALDQMISTGSLSITTPEKH